MKVINIVEDSIRSNFEKIRLPENIRDQLDLGYSFENNVLILFEIRPNFMDDSVTMNIEFAKARYYKSQQIWKLYWKRANGTWELYQTDEVNTIDALFNIIEEDEHGCFYG